MNAPFQLPALDEDHARLRGATIAQCAFVALKLAIMQSQLRPGNLLSEAEVAKQLGVSRQPVREAFIKLAEVGLVEIRPQRGTFVVLISRREVENARFKREAIEVAIARKACDHASEGDIAQLREIVERQGQASESGDPALFLGLDETFHRALARSVDCEYAWRIVENLKAQMDRGRYLSIQLATPLDNTLIAQHASIVRAIEQHDQDAAEKAMHQHLLEIIISLPKIAAANPDMFVD